MELLELVHHRIGSNVIQGLCVSCNRRLRLREPADWSRAEVGSGV